MDHFLFKISLIIFSNLTIITLNSSAAVRPLPLSRFPFLPIFKFILFLGQFDARFVPESVLACNSLDRVSCNFQIRMSYKCFGRFLRERNNDQTDRMGCNHRINVVKRTYKISDAVWPK